MKVNERKLLASYLREYSAFRILEDFNWPDWAFIDTNLGMIYKKIRLVIQNYGFEEYNKWVIQKGNETLLTQWKNIISDFDPKYLNIQDETDLFELREYLNERRAERLVKLTDHIYSKLNSGKDFSEELAAISELRPIGEVNDFMQADEIVESIDCSPKENYFTTGLKSIDSFVNILPSSLLVIGGESSSGKTTIANQFIINFLKETPYSAIYYSLETSQERLGGRIIKHLEYMEGLSWHKAKERFAELKKRLIVTKRISSINEITQSALDFQKRNDLYRIVVVDYLQIVESSEYKDEYSRINHVIRELHKLAQSHGFLVIVLCQLTKEDYPLVKGERKRLAPTMNSLRGAGQISNCADYIFINWYENVDFNSEVHVRPVNIQVVKSKEGRQGMARCLLQGASFTFMDEDDE